MKRRIILSGHAPSLKELNLTGDISSTMELHILIVIVLWFVCVMVMVPSGIMIHIAQQLHIIRSCRRTRTCHSVTRRNFAVALNEGVFCVHTKSSRGNDPSDYPFKSSSFFLIFGWLARQLGFYSYI